MKQNYMVQTKLETCMIILGAVENKQPTTIDEVQSEISLDCAALTEYLDFMAKQGIVRKIFNKSPVEYATTQKGKNVFRYFQDKTPSAAVNQTVAQEGY
jgi:predicted transcriptional regulator